MEISQLLYDFFLLFFSLLFFQFPRGKFFRYFVLPIYRIALIWMNEEVILPVMLCYYCYYVEVNVDGDRDFAFLLSYLYRKLYPQYLLDFIKSKYTNHLYCRHSHFSNFADSIFNIVLCFFSLLLMGFPILFRILSTSGLHFSLRPYTLLWRWFSVGSWCGPKCC